MTATTLTLPAELTIVHAAALRDTLHAALPKAPGAMRLDLGEVNEFDTAGVQLLLACKRTLHDQGSTLELVNCSSAVRRGLETFGLQALTEQH